MIMTKETRFYCFLLNLTILITFSIISFFLAYNVIYMYNALAIYKYCIRHTHA